MAIKYQFLRLSKEERKLDQNAYLTTFDQKYLNDNKNSNFGIINKNRPTEFGWQFKL